MNFLGRTVARISVGLGLRGTTSRLGQLAGACVGVMLAWACGNPAQSDECSPGALDCGCAFGLCDAGLACVEDVCVGVEDTSGSTTPEVTVGPEPGSSSTSIDAGSSEATSGDSGESDSTSTTSDTFGDEPVYEALVDGAASSFDIDPHAYVPMGTVVVRGDESGGQGAEMIVRFPVTGVGTYPCVLDDLGVALYWTIQGPVGVLEMSSRTTGDCTVTVEEFGEVGEFVTGTFEGLVAFPGSMAIPPVQITEGKFHVLRTEGV